MGGKKTPQYLQPVQHLKCEKPDSIVLGWTPVPLTLFTSLTSITHGPAIGNNIQDPTWYRGPTCGPMGQRGGWWRTAALWLWECFRDAKLWARSALVVRADGLKFNQITSPRDQVHLCRPRLSSWTSRVNLPKSRRLISGSGWGRKND